MKNLVKIIFFLILVFIFAPNLKADDINEIIVDNCYISDDEETYIEVDDNVLCISTIGELIFVQKDENITNITNDISKYLRQFLGQGSTYLEEFFPQEVSKRNLNLDKNKYFSEFYAGDYPNVSFVLGCIIDISGIRNKESDYFYCPSISSPENLSPFLELGNSSNLLPQGYFGGGLKEWTNDNEIQLNSNNGTLLLDLKKKTLSDSEGNLIGNTFSTKYIWLYGTGALAVLVGAVGVAGRKKKK